MPVAAARWRDGTPPLAETDVTTDAMLGIMKLGYPGTTRRWRADLPMSELEMITYRPGAGGYAWTLGGAAPVMRIGTPCLLDRYTERSSRGRCLGENGYRYRAGREGP